MSLHLLIGRAGSGKSTHMIQEVKRKLRTDPKGAPIIYLVPDQMSFQVEYELSSDPEIEGMMRAQVFSFSRLAYRILQEVGGISKIPLDQVGTTMMLRKIIEQRKAELKVFKRSAEQTGFYEQLEEMITEFKRYCFSAEDIKQRSLASSSALLEDKLDDLQLIYHDFERYTAEKYIDNEDTLRLLQERIPFSSYIAESEIFIDGFHQFTPQEFDVLEALMKHSPQITLSLTLDQPYEQLPHQMHLYYPTAQTFLQLRGIAESAEIPFRVRKCAQPAKKRFMHSPSLAHIEQNFDHRPVPVYDGELQVSLAAGVQRRAEVEGVGRTIVELVRDEGYRWRDIAIFVNDVAMYQEYIETVFEELDIPVFIDQKKPMLHHPLIEFIRSILDIFTQNWRYDAVFRCVKTDMLFEWETAEELQTIREAYDRVENHVLAHGIQGDKWLDDRFWSVKRYFSLEDEHAEGEQDEKWQDELNEKRDQLVHPLKKLEKRLKSAKTVREMCTELFLFLEQQNVVQKLERWRFEAENNGELHRAREHDQVWKSVIDLFDQLVEILGDEAVSLALFTQILESGCERLRFSLVPPALDQVVVGDMELSRFSHVQCAFMLGLNEGLIPSKPQSDGLLSEEDRERLQQNDWVLAPNADERLTEEIFSFYSGLCTPSEKLYLSYALADEEGKSLQSSQLLQRIQQMFPQLKEELYVNDAFEGSEDEQQHFIHRPRKTLTHLAAVMRHWRRGYPISTAWWSVYNWYVQQPEWKIRAKQTLGSLFYRNEAKPLSATVSKELYGDQIRASVSRMERYQACPFSQFLSHGLKLKERQVFRLEAPDIGQLFHAALKLIDDRLRKEGMSWSDLTHKECQKLAQMVVDEIAPRLQGQILLSSHRHAYIKRKLQQVVERATTVLHQHSKASQFVPVGMEIDFGPQGTLPPLRFTLANGTKMEVIGRIDRVDQAVEDQGLFLRVIDYKSSAKDLNLSEVYYGLSLQMLTYLDVIISYAKQWLGKEAYPAGVLYFHIHNPMLNHKTALPQDKVERELFRQFKMKGLVLSDEQVVQAMDTSLVSNHSEMIPVGLKKSGGFYSNSKIASLEEFEHLRTYVRKKIIDIGTQITDGRIEIKPYKMKQQVACTFCPYKSVCQYDHSLEENQYESLMNHQREQVIDMIRRTEGGE